MAQKVAMDIHDGAYVNLGIGMPELVAGFIPEGREVIYHTENGLLGMGKIAENGFEDSELVNAGKKYKIIGIYLVKTQNRPDTNYLKE